MNRHIDGAASGAFVLLVIGTSGLLFDAFVSDLGRTMTLLFAAANVGGLVLLGLRGLSDRRRT